MDTGSRSTALVAFDVLTVVLNRLVLMFGTTFPEADWAPIDIVLVLKGVIGVVLPCSASSRSQRPPRTTGSRRETQPRGISPVGGPIPTNQNGPVCRVPEGRTTAGI